MLRGFPKMRNLVLKHFRHLSRPPFGFKGFLTTEILVYRQVKQCEPVFEMLLINRQPGMRWEWTSEIGMLTEQYRLPKGVHPGKVFGPALPYFRIENGCQNFVFADFAIKCIHQNPDIFDCCDVVQFD